MDLKVKKGKNKCAIVFLSHWDMSTSLPGWFIFLLTVRKNCPMENFISELEFLYIVINSIILLKSLKQVHLMGLFW